VECRHKTHLFATYFHAMLATKALSKLRALM